MILRQRSKVKAAKWQKSDSGAALLFRSNAMNNGQSPLIKLLLKISPRSGRHRLSFRESKRFRWILANKPSYSGLDVKIGFQYPSLRIRLRVRVSLPCRIVFMSVKENMISKHIWRNIATKDIEIKDPQNMDQNSIQTPLWKEETPLKRIVCECSQFW